MVRTLTRIGVFLASCAIGLLIAILVVDDMTIDFGSFAIAVVIFAAVQALLTPLIEKVVRKHAEMLVGGVGLITTFVALLVTSLISSGMRISGVSTWIVGCVIVWLFTMIASMLLPLLIGKDKLEDPDRAKKPTK